MPEILNARRPIGASGSEMLGNQIWRSGEYNVDLATPQESVRTFERMRKSDGQVRGALNRLIYPLLAAQWRVDAAKEDPKGEEIAKFVRSVLMPGETYGYSGGGTTWYDFLRQAVNLTPAFGFSVFEKVWGYRPSDKKQVYAAIEARLPKTILHWNVTTDGPSRLESVRQGAIFPKEGYQEKDIPAELLIVFTFNREGDNYWGESILRPAHDHWRRKLGLRGFDSIQKERMGGIFWVQSKEGKQPTKAQVRAAKNVLENFRVHEKQGLYFPHVFEFHALFPGGEGGKYIESCEYEDKMIERCMMAEYMSQGSRGTGTNATATTQLESTLMGLQSVATLFEDGIGEQAVRELVETNYGERPANPRVACENFLQMNTDRLSLVLDPMIKNGAVRLDKPLRVYFRQKFSLPEEDEATMEPVPGAVPPALGGPDPTEGGDPVPARGGKKPAKRPGGKGPIQKRLKKAAPGTYRTYWRDVLPHERFVSFDKMAQVMDQEPLRIWQRVLLPAREGMIDFLAQHYAGATDAVQAKEGVVIPGRAKLEGSLSDALLSVYLEGRKSVLADRRRQLAGEDQRIAKAGPLFSDSQDEEDSADITPSKSQVSWTKRMAEGLVAGFVVGLIQRAIEAGQVSRDAKRDATRQERDIRTALEALSEDKQKAKLAGLVTRSFTNGRVEQGQAMSTDIATVYYSARLDNATCEACWAMDGQEISDMDIASVLPNPNCDWSPNCRCEPIYVFQEQQAALPAAA